MAGHVKCGGRSRYVVPMQLRNQAYILTGPAHAVYFATYEAVKHLMGGNQAGVHHPLAAGMVRILVMRFLLSQISNEWGMRNHSKRRINESI